MFKGFFREYFTLSAVLTIVAGSLSAQPNVAVTNNIERAHTLLNDVYGELNYNNSVGDVKMHIKGTYNYEGMSNKPGSARAFMMSGDIELGDGGGKLVRKDSFSRTGEDIIASFYDIDEEHINIKEAGEELKLTDKDKDRYLYKSLVFSPNLLLQVLLQDASRNSFISTTDNYHIIRHNNASGDAYFLYINANTYFLERIDQPMYDVVNGDYYRSIFFSKYDIQDGYQVPGKVIIKRDSNIIYDLNLELKEILPRVEYGTVRLSQKNIGEWLYLVLLPKWNHKSVIADMKDYLVVFEPPGNPEAGYTLLDNIKRAYPGKEIKYLVVSHLHPDLMGGVRPFMEEGVTIVTTEGNRSYFQDIAVNRHLFSKDVRVKKFITPKFQFVILNKQEIRAGDRIIQLYLLNKQSNHTDEYIISYIPQEKMLIESDLVKTWDLKEGRKTDKKEKGLMEFIEANKINVKQIMQSWPLEKAPHVVEFDQVKPESDSKLLKGSKKVLEVFN
jgi:glyoxylase-like metal-dependent hydrolase (beta-lactamase superfamily II)